MEEAFKSRLILILSVATAILFISLVSSCSSALHQKSERNKEMYTRIDLEEKMTKCLQEKTKAEEKLSVAEKALEAGKASLQATKDSLTQEQLVNQSLKEELQRVTKLKEALEDDLKEALVTGKAKSKK